MRIKLVSLLFCILLLNGCGSSDENIDSKLSLEKNNWSLVSYGFEIDEKIGVLENTNYSLYFNTTSEVSGNIDCNTFLSSYESDGESLSIRQVAPTEIACPLIDNLDYEIQTNFVQNALSTAQEYSIEGLELTITSMDSSQLIFIAVNE
mgnify:CR=1 FL=1